MKSQKAACWRRVTINRTLLYRSWVNVTAPQGLRAPHGAGSGSNLTESEHPTDTVSPPHANDPLSTHDSARFDGISDKSRDDLRRL